MAKEQIELLEEVRLLTEQEKKHILGTIENRSPKMAVLLCIIIVVLILALSVFIFLLGGVKESIINFFIWVIWVFPMLWSAWNTTSKLGDSIRKNEMYVKEAIYRGSNKYHYAAFEIKKNGRSESFCSNALNQDNAMCGDNVILVQMGKKQVWVYKAREDESVTN